MVGGTHCGRCPYRDVSGAIGTQGNIDASIAIVGEAPGANEIRTGVPFVGQAGQLLDRVLERSGIRRGDCYITNSMLCRPTESPPPREAIDACRGRLANELRAAPRQLIITFGNSALRSITGNHNLKITNERGRVMETPFGRVVPTIHPAAVLRGYSEFPKLLADVQYASKLISGGQVKSPGETKWSLVTPENVVQVVGALARKQYLAADIETSGYNPRHDRVLALGVSWEKNRVAIFPEDMMKHPMTKLLLETGGPRWIWHNGKFDVSFLQARRLNARGDEDTMLLHYALNEIRGTHDLKQLAGDYFGAPDYKEVLKKYLKKMSDSFTNIPILVLHEYLSKDADNTLQLFGALWREITKPGNEALLRLYQEVLMPASHFLQKVEARGMYVDKKYLDKTDEQLTTTLSVKREIILAEVDRVWDPEQYARDTGAKTAPVVFNPGSPLQLRWVLSKNLKRQIVTTREDTLIRLPQTRLVKSLLDFRETGKALSTYVRGLREHIEPRDGRVHSTYLLHGTTTGRLSSRGPNMQNIPRDKNIRNIFQAAPGNVLIEMDYSQIELRVLAYFSKDEFLTRVYTEGRDLHDEVALAMFGKGFTKEQRIRAKFLNFGIAYGRGAGSIVHEFGIPFEEASAMIRTWFRRAPQAADYIQACRRAPTSGRVLETPFGRRRRFGLITRENLNTLQNEAVNFPMQSTASDLTLTFAMSIDTALRANWGAGIVNLIHDSVLVEVPERSNTGELVEWMRERMKRHPQTVLETTLPFDVSVAIGTRWGDVSAG